jgi:hypothetical protein
MVGARGRPVVRTFIIKYFVGMANGICLIFAKNAADAQIKFLEHHPALRAYNIRGCKETRRDWFELREAPRG